MKSGPLCLTLALAIAVGSAAGKQPPPRKGLVPGEGIFLLLKTTRDRITLERLVGAEKPATPEKPSLAALGWERHPPGTEELLISLHDKKGKAFAVYGFPVRLIAFHDTIRPGSKTLVGGLTGVPSVELPLQVPYPKGTAALYFWRVTVGPQSASPPGPVPTPFWRIEGIGPYGPVALTARPAGGVSLVDLPFDLGKLDFKSVLSALRVFPKRVFQPMIPHTLGTGPDPFTTLVCPSNAFTTTNIGAGTSPATSFNVVILGDGYKAGPQMAGFIASAKAVKGALLASQPFSAFSSQINVYTVETPSMDSGVDHCPRDCVACPCPIATADPKATALEVSGDLSGLGVCTEFTADPLKIYVAGCAALAPGDVDLYIVLVNCDVYGGMSYPATRTVYVAAGHAADMIVHEAGHALAAIGEEYLGGVLPCTTGSCTTGCPGPVEFINVALPAAVAANQVPWFPLAKSTELVSGRFKTIENQSQHDCYEVPGTPEGPGQKLGLYWGAQYLANEPDPDPYCDTCQGCRANVGGQCVTICYDVLCDERGADFYRPMPYCTMRFLESSFCRVCDCALRDVLEKATGLSPASNWCP